jgi:Tol biopolymer transport system component
LPPLTGSGGVIAFTSERDGNMEIYVMNADGSDQRRLTNQSGEDYWPTWSPDGSQIAFASERDGNFEIYIMSADGNNQRRLTRSGDSASDLEPAWSPDGTQIAFMSHSAGKGAIYVVDVDGAEQGSDNRQPLTDGSGDDWLPAWSPDGSRIAFVSHRDGNPEIYVMNADGSNQQRLTDNVGDDSYPAWSPDGTWISFSSVREGSRGLYVMDVDGAEQGSGNLQKLTHDDASVWVSAWSPDGTKIAFTSDRDGNREIYVMDADGAEQGLGNLRRLTNDLGLDGIPAWRPRPLPLAITFVDNDCFLIASGETKILTDASEIVPPKVWQRIAQAQPPFDDVDLLLSTHAHGDHFDAELTRAYLERNPNGIFVSTRETVDLLQKDYPAFEEVQERVKAFEPGEGERIAVTLNGIDLEILNLPHGVSCANIGFIIHIGGRKVLHTGDVSAGIAFHQKPDSDGVDFLQSYGVANEGIDVAFVHYHFIIAPEFRTKAGGNVMLDTVRARWVVPMHYDFTSSLMHSVFQQLKTRCPDCIIFHEVMETRVIQ